MKEFLSEAKFILLILFVISAVSGVSYFEFEPEQKLNYVPEHSVSPEAIFVDHSFKITRKLASVKEDESQILDQTFFCNHSLDEKKIQSKSNSNLVMINFKICKDSKNIDSVSLINETNGFKAQLFKSPNAYYKTDYVQLNAGTNKIIVEVVLKDGQKNTDSLVILTGS